MATSPKRIEPQASPLLSSSSTKSGHEPLIESNNRFLPHPKDEREDPPVARCVFLIRRYDTSKQVNG
jgi:hypothetical protein